MSRHGSAHRGERRQHQTRYNLCTRTTHHRGQNEVVAQEKPSTPTRSAGASLTTGGVTIASFFARPQTIHPCCTCASSSGNSGRRASLGNACHASHRSKSCPNDSICRYYGCFYAMVSPPLATDLEAPKSANQRGLPYHPWQLPGTVEMCVVVTCGITPLRPGVGVPRVPNITYVLYCYHPPTLSPPGGNVAKLE